MYARDVVLFATQAVGIGHNLFQGEHRKQGYREFCNDEDAGDGAELVVHRHVIQEEIRKAHEVFAPRQ